MRQDIKQSEILIEIKLFRPWLASCLFFLTIGMLVLTMQTTPASANGFDRNKTAVLKTNGHITAAVITVGDIFENAGVHASHVLAPAPKAGDSLTLGIYDLKRISTAFNLGWHPLTAQDQIVLKRHATDVKHDEINTFIKSRLAQETRAEDFEIDLHHSLPELQFGGDTHIDFKADEVTLDPYSNRFSMRIGVRAQNGQSRTIDISGTLHPVLQLPVLARNLRNGDIITKQDIRFIPVRTTQLNQNYSTDATQLIGLTPRRMIISDRPVQITDLEKPKIIKKGQYLTLKLRSGALNLTAKGKALQHGAMGDTIRVINTSSNRIIEAEITGPQSVSVATTPATL